MISPALLSDFIECMDDSLEALQTALLEFEAGRSRTALDAIFRHLHTLKGNCAVIAAEPVVDLLHKLEDVLDNIRSGHFSPSRQLGQLIDSVIGHAEALLRSYIDNRVLDAGKADCLARILEQISRSTPTAFSAAIDRFLDRSGGPEARSAASLTAPQQVSPGDQLAFFHSLAEKIDNASQTRAGSYRTRLTLLQALNARLGDIVDPDQLEAAACLHDIGLRFIPGTAARSSTVPGSQDVRSLHDHVYTGAELLKTIGGWDTAARIVLEHHELYNGSGYPNRRSGDAIHPGARMLSIVDAFCLEALKGPTQTSKNSLFKAIAHLNIGAGTRYDPAYVRSFNTVVRSQYVKQEASAGASRDRQAGQEARY